MSVLTDVDMTAAEEMALVKLGEAWTAVRAALGDDLARLEGAGHIRAAQALVVSQARSRPRRRLRVVPGGGR